MDPYIFISYCRRDKDRVVPLIRAMQRRGYRVWYDKYIDAGDPWEDVLAKKIPDCAVFLSFLSPAYFQSDRCKQEVKHARREHCRIVPVWLDELQTPTEFAFLVKEYNGFRIPSGGPDGALLDWMDSKPAFRPCRGDEEPEPRKRTVGRAALVTGQRSIVPSRRFVGRKEKMAEIETAFRQGATVVALCGMGGIGKSEICRKLLHTYTNGPGTDLASRIGWVTWQGSLRDTFYRQFREIQDENVEQNWSKAQNYMRDAGADLLMVLDNADTMEQTDAEELTGYGCRFLLTTRKWRLSNRLLDIPAGTLTQDQCLELYRRTLPPGDPSPEDTLKEIIRLAGRHTLAVKLLAQTQDAAALTAAELLAELQRTGFHLSGILETIEYHHRPEQGGAEAAEAEARFLEHMGRIFDLSAVKDGEVLGALQGCCLLAPNVPIARRTLKKWLDLPSLDGVNRAVKSGWLNEEPGGAVSIHPVIAAVVRREAMPGEDVIDALAEQLRRDMIPGMTEVFTTKLPVLEHAIALDDALGSHALRTENYGNMLGQMGYLLLEQAKYENALAYMERGVKIEEQVLGIEHRETATSYNNIGAVYREQGNHAQALKWFQKALKVREKVLGPEHPDTATSYNNIGAVYREQGNHAQALEWFQKALKVMEKVLGPEHPDTASSYNNIGAIYDDLGDYAWALKWFEKALKVDEKVLGPEHPDTASSYNNIGGAYYGLGDSTKELEYYEKALKVWEKVLGSEHPNTAATYHNIGTVYCAQGDYAEALQWLEKALAVRSNVLGPEHPLTKTTQWWIDYAHKKMNGG